MLQAATPFTSIFIDGYPLVYIKYPILHLLTIRSTIRSKFPEAPFGLQVGLVLPSWAAKAHLGAKLGCQGALGRHFGLQLGLQVPLQSAPDPSEP